MGEGEAEGARAQLCTHLPPPLALPAGGAAAGHVAGRGVRSRADEEGRLVLVEAGAPRRVRLPVLHRRQHRAEAVRVGVAASRSGAMSVKAEAAPRARRKARRRGAAAARPRALSLLSRERARVCAELVRWRAVLSVVARALSEQQAGVITPRSRAEDARRG